jgi:ATP-dependent DNA ligase
VAAPAPPTASAFDVLHVNRRDVSQRPLRERRARLEDVVAGSELVFPVRRLAPDGVEAWRQVIERGYEGLVAKDEAGVYEGGPTKRWLKVKVPGRTDAEERWRRLKTAPSHGPVESGASGYARDRRSGGSSRS